MKADELLISLDACVYAVDFSKNKSIKETWETCHRGDWMLWFYWKQFPSHVAERTLAKSHCANTVRHLMRDERSKKAVDIAIKFGEGLATKDELIAASSEAYAARSDFLMGISTYSSAYSAAAAAAAAADPIVSSSAPDSSKAVAYDAINSIAFVDADFARKQNLLETADICRKYLDISTLYGD